MTAPIMISMRFVIVEFSCARGRGHFCCETTAPGASDGAAGFHQPGRSIELVDETPRLVDVDALYTWPSTDA